MKAVSFKEAAALWRCNRERAVIPTGIKPLDDILEGGLPVRQITTLGAYTGHGKSEFARQIARRIMQHGFRVIIVDVELGADRIFERFYVQEAELPRGQLAAENYHNVEEESDAEVAMKDLEANTRMTIFAPGNMPALDKLLEAVSEEIKAAQEISRQPMLVIFDSVQRLSLGQPSNSLREGMTHFMGELENFAHTHNIAALAISELSRDPKRGIPTPDKMGQALAESRAIEYVSDVVMFLVPDKNHHAERERAVHLVVNKNRSGEIGTVEAKFVFLYPCWGMRVDADAMVALQLAVLKFFDKGPATIEECALALKKRKHIISKITREWEASKKIKPIKTKGSKGFQLVSTAWEQGDSESPTENEEKEAEQTEGCTEKQQENQEAVEE